MIDFKIKICGITNTANALQAAEFGAGAIGLNFYSRSLRNVTIEKAQEIAAGLRKNSTVKTVGVFVNESATTINSIADKCDLDYVQLHGDESHEMVSEIGRKVIRAIRVSSFKSAQQQIDAWTQEDIVAILLDAATGAHFGGTGKQIDWDRIKELTFKLPLILAGGLNCDNVAQAILQVNPAAVDVASGVETFPGSKDRALMQAFIAASNDVFPR